MKKFKEILEEAYFVYNINGINIYYTAHSDKRKIERKATEEEIKEILKRFIDKILKDNLPEDEYLVYSKEFKRGIICDYDGMNKIKLITILQKYHQTTKEKTKKLIVEDIIFDDLLLKEAQDEEMIFYIVYGLLERDLKNEHDNSVEIVDLKEDGLTIILCDNVLYDIDVSLVTVE